MDIVPKMQKERDNAERHFLKKDADYNLKARIGVCVVLLICTIPTTLGYLFYSTLYIYFPPLLDFLSMIEVCLIIVTVIATIKMNRITYYLFLYSLVASYIVSACSYYFIFLSSQKSIGSIFFYSQETLNSESVLIFICLLVIGVLPLARVHLHMPRWLLVVLSTVIFVVIMWFVFPHGPQSQVYEIMGATPFSYQLSNTLFRLDIDFFFGNPVSMAMTWCVFASFLRLFVVPIMFSFVKQDLRYGNPKTTFSFKRRSVALSIFLSVTTCGIYFLYWFASIVEQVRYFHKDYRDPSSEILLNIFVPFYGYYWFYTRGKQMYHDSVSRGGNLKDSSGVYLVLSILGMSIVALALMQNAMNNYTSSPKSTHGAMYNNQNPGLSEKDTPEKTVMDSMNELASLLDAGLITQEDFEKKKQDILNRI